MSVCLCVAPLWPQLHMLLLVSQTQTLWGHCCPSQQLSEASLPCIHPPVRSFLLCGVCVASKVFMSSILGLLGNRKLSL